jgi:phosphoglycerol geranylgeranyltransferase
MIYPELLKARKEGRKLLSILVDPDKTSSEQCEELAQFAREARVDYFLVGSSILTRDHLTKAVRALKKACSIPVILFPGNTMQLCDQADGILFLSMISGRNPELLIGKHVIAAPMLRESGIEVISTGYMLVDCGHPTSVSYMSHTLPIPHDKEDIAACTAMAGEMLGLKTIYMDAGSGAKLSVSTRMIKAVRETINVPLIVGGGIRTAEKIIDVYAAGAEMVVIGNALEKDPALIFELTSAARSVRAE